MVKVNGIVVGGEGRVFSVQCSVFGLVGAGRGVFECATYTCSHCQVVVMINPLRTRERAYCLKCDHRICDVCGAIRAANGGECKTMKQIGDELIEQNALIAQKQGIILPAQQSIVIST